MRSLGTLAVRLAIDAVPGRNRAGEARFGDPDGWLVQAESFLEVTREFETLRAAGQYEE